MPPSSPPAATPFDARQGAKEALWAAAGLVTLLALTKPFTGAFPFAGDVVFTLSAAWQLYIPLWLIQRRGETPESHKIHVHGLLLGPIAALRKRLVSKRRAKPIAARGGPIWMRETLAYYGRDARLDARGLGRDLGLALLLALLTFPPFAVGHYLIQGFLLGAEPLWRLRIPPDLGAILLTNVFLVGLPEELFYRGFVETRLERLWPTQIRILLIPLSRTVVVASAFFALGHFVGEWNPARLLPFFPAFVFSALARNGNSIAGAVLYHGLSNAFSATLLAGYR